MSEPIYQYRPLDENGELLSVRWCDCEADEYERLSQWPEYECRILYTAGNVEAMKRIAGDSVDAAAFIERKAEEYARDFGHSDMGCLSFGSGDHAQVKMDHYTSLMELAEEIRALSAPSASAQQAEPLPACRPGRWRDGDACEPAAPAPASPADQVEDARDAARLTPCKGMNCGCTDGVNHSVECQAEHAAAIAGGRFVK